MTGPNFLVFKRPDGMEFIVNARHLMAVRPSIPGVDVEGCKAIVQLSNGDAIPIAMTVGAAVEMLSKAYGQGG